MHSKSKETISANERRLESPAQFPAKFVSIGKNELGVISEYWLKLKYGMNNGLANIRSYRHCPLLGWWPVG
jgi:hypothetical protein